MKTRGKLTGTIRFSATFDFKDQQEMKEFAQEILEDKDVTAQVGPFEMDVEEVFDRKWEEIRH